MSAACALLVVWTTASDGAAVKIQRDAPVELYRHYAFFPGKWNENGDFVPWATARRPVRAYDGPTGGMFSEAPNRIQRLLATFEYRSRAIVPGVMSDKLRGVFVPEVGGVVRASSSPYGVEPGLALFNTTPIYNTSDYRLSVGGVPHVVKRFRPLPDGVTPNLSILPPPAGLRLQSADNASDGRPRPTIRVVAGQMEYGWLTDRGDFAPEAGLPPLEIDLATQGKILARAASDSTPAFYNLPRSAGSREQHQPEPVYEYRSGRLIRGTLHDTGHFAPEVGSTVIALRDFDPATDKRRIYNLPGVLVRDPAPPAPKP